jgi:CBS domain containing-hemolysin-like protein
VDAVGAEVPGLGLTSLGLLAIGVLVLTNAYFVATEFALVAVRRSEVKLWVAQGRRGGAAVAEAILHLDDAIAATQLGITVASIGLGWVGEPTLARLFTPGLGAIGIESPVALHALAGGVAFGLVTFLHVVVGELAPKAVALDRPGDVARACARPLLVFGRVFRVVLKVMNGAGNGLVRLVGVQPASGIERVHSAEELHLLVSEAGAAGAIRPETGRLLGNVFRISRRRVRDVMVPRARVFAIDRKTDPEGLLDRLREEGYTRLPVYDGSLDRIAGILHTKDLFHLYAKTRLVVLDDAVRPAMEIGPDAGISEALRVFRRSRRHMAIVREKDGPVLGIVTLEDVLEEIVGEIEDEHDEPTPAGIE